LVLNVIVRVIVFLLYFLRDGVAERGGVCPRLERKRERAHAVEFQLVYEIQQRLKLLFRLAGVAHDARPRHPLDVHRGLPRRDGRGVSNAVGLRGRVAVRPRGCVHVLVRAGDRVRRARRPHPRRSEAGAAQPADGVAAAHLVGEESGTGGEDIESAGGGQWRRPEPGPQLPRRARD